jgi:hypothetical protein
MHIVGTGGPNNFSLSYSGSKRGGGCEIACAHFSSEMANRRSSLETLDNASLSLINVHIVRTGGSNYFSSSYDGFKRVGGCEIVCALSSS